MDPPEPNKPPAGHLNPFDWLWISAREPTGLAILHDEHIRTDIRSVAL
jgi:hypothetical protein